MAKKDLEQQSEEQNAPQAGVPVDTVEKLVDSFQSAVEKINTAPTPAAPAAPKVDTEARIKKAQEAYNAARERANELAEAGDAAGGMEEMYKATLAYQQATQGAPEDNPQVKAMVSQARRVARSENSEMFNSYESEIQAEIAKLPVADQINPDAWDKAVNIVKANHIEEILEQRARDREANRKQEEEEALQRRDFTTPTARGGRATRAAQSETIDPESLSEDERDIAAACGLTLEQYADATVRYQKAPKSKHGVAILDEEPGARIAPGKF